MLRCVLMGALGSVGLSMALGCSSRDVIVPIYDACGTVENCVQSAELCEELAVEFAGLIYSNAICTVTCEVGGVASADCPRALIGRAGSCYPSSVAGGVDDTLICFEPCEFNEDCLFGFRCLGARDLCPAGGAPCPIDENDAICVPGPR